MKTVIKANYVKASQGGLARAQRSARYYMQRPDREGEKQVRPGFTLEAEGLKQEAVDKVLEQAEEKGATHYYRMVLSPGEASKAEGDLKEWTRDVLPKVQEQQTTQLPWVAFEHSDERGHSGHAHVHAVVATGRKITRGEFKDLREEATQSWERQKDFYQELARDPMREPERGRVHAQELGRDRG